MRKSLYPEEKIIRVLKQVESGQKVEDVIREHGIWQQTSYRRKPSFGEYVSDLPSSPRDG